MPFLKRFFSSPQASFLEEYSIELKRNSKKKGLSGKERFKKVISFPFVTLKKLRNTYLLIRYKEFRAPLEKNVCPLKWINSFASPQAPSEVTSSLPFMKEILKHPRKDPKNGIFDDRENARVFLSALKDMYPEEEISEDDFLLTCNKEYVIRYRQPIMKFIGPQNIKHHGLELEKIVEDNVLFWKKKSQGSKINVTELSLIFTTDVISRLLLGHPGPFEVYGEIAYAIDCINKLILKRRWGLSFSEEEKAKYKKSIFILKKAIHLSLTTQEKPILGSLVDALREEKQMSELQIKCTLFLMYFAGSETTASLLSYLFWQLGQHLGYQEEIFQEIQKKNRSSLFELAHDLESVDKLFAESIRLFTPGYIIGRQPADDLICTIKDKHQNVVFYKEIPKENGLLCAPTFAGRNPTLYKNPDAFDPHRFQIPPKTLPWMPFGEGRHLCLGQWLAKSQVMTLVASLVRNFHIKSFPEKEITQKGYLTLKPGEDVWCELKERKK
jgi:cytochrome P450